MTQKYSSLTIPPFGPLIENILIRYVANVHIGATLKNIDSEIIHFVSSKYLQTTRTRSMELGLDRNELAKLCNVSLRLFVNAESFPLYEKHLVENAVENLRHDRSTRNVLRVFKKMFPAIKSEINKRMIYYWLIKILIHEVLLERELQKKAQDISKSKNIPLWEIHDSLLGLDSVRHV